MSATVSITQEDIFTQLRAFILSLIAVPPDNVIQGLGNGVASPLGDFIVMTTISQERLATNFRDYTHYWDDLKTEVTQAVKQQIQIDCFGENSGEYALILATALRDFEGCDAFTGGIAPLYVDEPKLMPFEDGEQNYTKRWTFNLHLQFNGVITL